MFDYSIILLDNYEMFLAFFSILFSRFWIIFIIITLNSLSDILPVYPLFIWSCGFSSSFFIPMGAFLVAQMVKKSACNAGDTFSIPGLRSSPVEENGNPLLYSCLENSMHTGTWKAVFYSPWDCKELDVNEQLILRVILMIFLFLFCLTYCVTGLSFSQVAELLILFLVSALIEWGWSSFLWKFHGGRDWFLCSGGWTWIFSNDGQGHVRGVLWGIYGLSMTLSGPLANERVCVPVLLVVWHRILALCSPGSWVESRHSFWWCNGSCHQFIFPGAKTYMTVHCPGLVCTLESQAWTLVWESRQHKSFITAIKGNV